MKILILIYILFLPCILISNDWDVVPLFPAANQRDVPLTAIFHWSAAPRANFYRIQIAKDIFFQDIIYDQSAIKDTFFRIGILENNTNYYWRACSGDDYLTGKWSRKNFFTTLKIDFNQGLVAHYNFDDNANLGKDATGRNNAVEIKNVNSSDNAPKGKSAFFNGNGFIRIPQSQSFLDMQTMSLLYWTKYYKPNSGLNDVATTICNGGDDPNPKEDGLFNYVAPTNIAHFLGRIGSPQTVAISFPTDGKTPLENKQFQHISFIVDVNSIHGYQNACYLTEDVRNGMPIARPNQDWWIGCSGMLEKGYPYYLTGYIDDVRIYNRVLNSEEIHEIYRLNGGGTLVQSEFFVDFGIIKCKNDSTHTIKIRNNGTYPIDINSIHLKNNNGIFSVRTANSISLSKDDKHSIDITANHIYDGVFQDTLIIETNNACNIVIPIKVEFVDFSVKITNIQSDTIYFGVHCAPFEIDTTIILENQSNTPFTIFAYNITSPFSFPDAPFPLYMPAKSTKAVKLKMKSDEAGKFTSPLILSEFAGCEKLYVIKSEVLFTPEASITGGPLNICEGDTAILMGHSTGSGDKFYWSNGSKTQNIKVNKTGNYVLIVENQSGCRDTSSIFVKVDKYITAGIIGEPGFCDGYQTVLSAIPNGEGYRYKWSTGDTTSSIIVHSGGKYTVEVRITDVCKDTGSIEVKQYSNPEVRIEPGNRIEICHGKKVKLKANVKASSSFKWSNNSTASEIEVSESGLYSVIATSQNGCLDTAYTEVFVKEALKPAIADIAVICEGDSVLLSPDNFYYKYRWNNGDTTHSIYVKKSGQYWVNVTDSSGCEGISNTFRLTVNKLPKPEILGNFVICEGDTSFLVAKGSYPEYLWSNSENTNYIKVTGEGKYFLKVRDNNGCYGISDTVGVFVKKTIETIFSDGKNYIDFDTVNYLSQHCKELELRNTSDFPILLHEVSLQINIPYSLPQSQFPMIIPPHSSNKLVICYMPTGLGLQNDTLTISDSCGSGKYWLTAYSAKNLYLVDSKCNLPVSMITTEFKPDATFKSFLPYPNPVNQFVSVPFVRLYQDPALVEGKAELFSLLGGKLMDADIQIYVTKNYTEKIYEEGEFIFDCSRLMIGNYFIRIKAGNYNALNRIIIIR